MRAGMYYNYIGSNLAIIGTESGFGAVSSPDCTELIRPIYEEVMPLDLEVKTLLVYERRLGGLVIGIFSASLCEWLHYPQFTDITIKDKRTLWVYVGKLKGQCDLTTGELIWFV